MPRLLLEGKSITALLAQVRNEHGNDVTIVAAEKVRSGGLGGFFAKESYSLTVEVDAVPAESPAELNHSLMHERSVEAPGSLLDLAAAIDQAEAAENSVILATRPMHATIQEPMLSTASPEFASILARLTALDAPQPAAEPVLQADAYTRLRDALAEIAPHVDFGTNVPLVLVIPPAAPPAPVIPRQGRHRRAVQDA